MKTPYMSHHRQVSYQEIYMTMFGGILKLRQTQSGKKYLELVEWMFFQLNWKMIFS